MLYPIDRVCSGEEVVSPTSDIFGLPKELDSLRICTKLLYSCHPNLGNTAARAMAVCRTLGEMLELPSQERKSLIWAAAFHDLSLASFDRWLVRRWLRFPEKCSKQEIESLRTHPVQSQQMLSFLSEMDQAGEIIRSHHENWDGSGYPDRLGGDAIPWFSRLLAVILAYCGKISAGPTAFSELQANAGRMFDPQAVLAVCKIIPFTNLPPGEREVLLTELKPGMVLASDIHTRDGFLIVPKGYQIRQNTINKLLRIHGMTPLNLGVLVAC